MLHLDEARRKAIAALTEVLESEPRGSKAVLIDDLFGRLRLVLWSRKKDRAQALRQDLDARLRRECGRYWTEDIWLAHGGGKISEADRKLYDRAWNEAQRYPGGKVRLLDRHRNRGGWFQAPASPLWRLPASGISTSTPPIVVFYSFKGGVGRTTALASVAMQQARRGERVVAIDADLDAPGLGNLLTAAEGRTAEWGIVDYLLERPQGEVDLRDYYHACRREPVTGSGEILVFPAGRVDGDYLGKLARVDLEPDLPATDPHPLHLLLNEVRTELAPHWILVDIRAGLADPAGMLLGGLGHLHVLFGTFSDQSWAGLRLVIDRLGGERVRAGQPQADCLLVQAMVPENADLSKQSREAFNDRARDEFVDSYYAAETETSDSEDDFLRVGDAESSDAPHVAVPLSYSSRLAGFSSIDAVADHLTENAELLHLASRINARLGAE